MIDGDDAPGDIRRFTLADMPEWGPWLTGRLRDKWPTIDGGSFLGKVHAWNASNDFLFIRNDLAVGLAGRMLDNMDSRPYVRAIFTFARNGAAQSSPARGRSSPYTGTCGSGRSRCGRLASISAGDPISDRRGGGRC
jgi:hypothetical protein